MAEDSAKVVISIETILRGLDKTVRGLNTVEKQLKSVSNVKAQTGTATALNRASIAAQKYAQQQQRLEQSSRRLAIAQRNIEAANIRAATSYERARLAAQRLEAQQNKIAVSASRLSRASSSFMGGVAGGLTALFGVSAINSIQQAGAAILEYANKLETTKIAFTTMLGSAEAATAHLKELQAFAVKTPFQFGELIDASQRMQALGFAAEQVVPLLEDIGNAVAAAGGGAQRLDRVVLALSQMQSKGRVATQELNQLAEAGINGFKILGEATGKSRAELVKMVEAGKVSSAVFLDAFQKFSKQNFGGLMEQQAKTFSGAMSNIKDALLQTSAVAFSPLFAKLSETAQRIGELAIKSKEFRENMEVVGKQLERVFDGVVKFIHVARDAFRLFVAAVFQQIAVTIHSFQALVRAIHSAVFALEALARAAIGDFVGAAIAMRKSEQQARLGMLELRDAAIAAGGVIREIGKIMDDAGERAAALARKAVDAANALKGVISATTQFGEISVKVGRKLEIGAGVSATTHTPPSGIDTDAAAGAGASALRTAQERFAKAQADIALAGAERLGVIEKAKNDRLLQENENAYRLQIVSYRQYLNRRAQLTSANLQLEINAQQQLVDEALAERDRFLARAGAKGVKAPERVRAQAGAKEAEAKAIEATTRLLELQERQRGLITEVKQLTAEALQEQQKDIRQLQIEYAALTGRIEDSLNAATDEKFREALQDLALAQDDLNKRLEVARETGDAEAQVAIENASRINQTQIEAIKNIVDQERATNRLAAAQELVRQAKEQQAQLESDLAFEVEFRGLKEEDAIRKRLEGEQQLADSLRISRDIVKDTIAALEAKGVKPPQALIDFIKGINASVKGLGELSFSEQFRLAEQEFIRINDERISKIQDVERAVRNRDIAEIEGRILVKKINGEYVEDLERQLALLKQIAEASGQEELKRQAQVTGETVKDAQDELASFDRQLRSVSIDALESSLSQFFKDLRDNTESAAQDILNFLDRIATRITDLIAENLAQELVESIFGGGKEGQEGGIVGSIKRIFGIGGGGEETTAANTTATDANTEELKALNKTLGGQPAQQGLEGIGKKAITDPLGVFQQVTDFARGIFGGGAGGEKTAQGGTEGKAPPEDEEVPVGSLKDALGIGGTGPITSVLQGMDAIVSLLEQILKAVSPEGALGSGGLSDFASIFGDEGTTEITAGATLTAGATSAATALTAGGVSFATAITTGVAALVAGMTAAAAGFGTAVITAGAAFATSVTASSAASAATGLAGLAGGATGMFPAVPGGAYRFVEGGYPEAVLTTDPKHAVRQAQILKEYLAKTKGLFGRFKVPEFAEGGFISPREVEMNMLNSIERTSPIRPDLSDAVLAGGGSGDLRLRQIFVDDQRDVRNWINSSEGEQVITEKLIRNRPLIRRLAGGRN